MAQGVDYSFARPSPAGLVAAGKSFVCRYLSGDFRHDDQGQKDLSIQERDALLSVGLAIVVVWETDGRTDPSRGAVGGHADAVAAVQEASALGVPQGACLYFAVDYQTFSQDVATMQAYAAAARDVCHAAGYRAGIYGGIATEQDDESVVDMLWQTYAWSAGQWDPKAQLRQYENGANVAGGSVDLDESTVADFGQFPVVMPPPPAPTIARLTPSAGIMVPTPVLP